MLTYVINTSENKTFDSDRLFDLAGYNKIRWHNCLLSDIKQCAQEIFEKQNILGADRFRIAVLIDFYGFDRVRVPYGRLGFGGESGVDISLYMPYIEAYLMDNLIAYLELRELYAEDFEIYYVQNSKLERYEFVQGAEEQLKQVIGGLDVIEGSKDAALLKVEELKKQKEELDGDKKSRKKDKSKDGGAEDAPAVRYDDEVEEELVVPEAQDLVEYSSFSLYCTPSVSLKFYLKDYPYGSTQMTLVQFFEALRDRMGVRSTIRRYYYVTSYGGGKARLAFDTLSLSLYLIRMYEREESFDRDGEIKISRLDANRLKEVLETAWIKVCIASEVAKSNDSKYIALSDNLGADYDEVLSTAVVQEIPLSLGKENLSVEETYEKICYLATRTPEQVSEDHRKDFDDIMGKYLVSRDETRERNMEIEFEERIHEGALKKTSYCPSKAEFDAVVAEKQKKISDLFADALEADYISVDFDDEKKAATKIYREYVNAKACLPKKMLGDFIIMLLAMLSVFVPYTVLQLTHYGSGINIWLLAINMLALFAGLYVLAAIIRLAPILSKLRKCKEAMNLCYAKCRRKESYSMSKIRHRYEIDLINIERQRYAIRQLKRFYDANVAIDRNIQRHRDMLREVKDRIAGILNNLDVEPIFDPYESVEGEFDVNKPIRSKDNKVYRVFSIETIEAMFPKKGSDEQ